jgi:2-oxoglutarate ferredoxin oxidoreductase subunit alpha
MERLRRKFQTAATLVPAPEFRNAAEPTRVGVIYFGSTSPAMQEGLDVLDAEGIHIDGMRLRAYPFPASVLEFIEGHDTLFVVEQNHDAQMHMLLVNELEVDPKRLTKVLHYDGTPITERFITDFIRTHLNNSAAGATQAERQEEVV